MTIFPGLLRPRSGGAGPEFIPLLRTDNTGGVLFLSDAVQQSFMGISGINPRRRHIPSGTSYTLAARLTGAAAVDKTTETEKRTPPRRMRPRRKPSRRRSSVIAVADLDLISEQFFELRRLKVGNLDFDNVTFVLNCVDVLAGDESFVTLRKKRPQHRTLLTLEAQTKKFIVDLQEQTKAAEEAAKDKLDQAQKAFDKQVDQVKSRTDLDDRTKEIMLANLQEVAQRRLDIDKARIEDEKLTKIRESKAESEQKTRAIENRVRSMAVAIPPLPP